MITLYGADLSSPSNKVRFVLHLLELEYEYRRVALRKGEHQRPEFLQVNPIGKIPVIDDDGFLLAESNAICKYLCQKKKSELYVSDLRERAIIDQWIDFGSFHIGAAMSRVVFNRLFAPVAKAPVDPQSLADGLKFLNRFLPVVENQLGRHPYLTGETLTLADINLLATLDPAEAADVDLVPYVRLSTWRKGLQQRDFYTRCYQNFGEALKQVMAGQV